MLRLEQIKLPFDHPKDALVEAILKRLKISSSELLNYRLIKRSIDARRNDQIKFRYYL